jgi:hypothetical protein
MSRASGLALMMLGAGRRISGVITNVPAIDCWVCKALLMRRMGSLVGREVELAAVVGGAGSLVFVEGHAGRHGPRWVAVHRGPRASPGSSDRPLRNDHHPTGQQPATTVVGTGTSGYDGNQDAVGNLLPGTQIEINRPGGLSVTLNGEIVFADTGNHLIRAYVPSTGNVIDDLGGPISGSVPQGGFNGDSLAANQTKFENPAAVTVTRGALLVVADTGNSRLRQIGPNPLPPQLGGVRGMHIPK